MRAAHAVVTILMCVALASCGHARPGGPGAGHRSQPTSIPRGVPDGRPVAAAVADPPLVIAVKFVCSGQRLLDTDPTQLSDVIRSMWTTSAADAAVSATVNQLAELRDRLSTGQGPTRYRQAVVATRTDHTSATQVEVSVWWVGVLSREGAVLPQAQWTTSTITLSPQDGTWRVEAESSEPGPAPDASSDSAPLSHLEFERRLDGFGDWEASR